MSSDRVSLQKIRLSKFPRDQIPELKGYTKDVRRERNGGCFDFLFRYNPFPENNKSSMVVPSLFFVVTE